jgi:hypothetical protein
VDLARPHRPDIAPHHAAEGEGRGRELTAPPPAAGGSNAETPVFNDAWRTRGEGEFCADGTSTRVVGMSGQTQAHSSRILLTGRGAVMVMLAVFALGLLGASWTPWPVLAGAFFVIGSVAAVVYVRPGDLLMVTIVPPLLFGIALLGVKAATATGNVVLSIAEGAAITMAEVAPWLFAGMVLTLVIAWARGLGECIRELRQDLRADGHRPADHRPTDRRPDAAASRPGPAAADPPPPAA